MCATIHKKSPPPEKPPSFREAVRMIASLGGFLGRKGEVLPRSRRIFHVSPTDQRHLDDICDLLCKFGYIMRSPSSPNGLHLYGMSSYCANEGIFAFQYGGNVLFP